MSSLSTRLWEDSIDIADDAYKTKFIQGISSGTLNPPAYSAYMNQDIAFVFKASEYFGTVASRATTDDLKRIMGRTQQSYARCADDMGRQFSLRDQTAVIMGEAAEEYCQFLHRVANGMDPIYFLVAMIPCARLWPWLAAKIQAEQTKPNLYSFWAEENMSDSCAQRLESFIDRYASELDEQQAFEVYQTSMKMEVRFFKSATGEQVEDIDHMPQVRLASV